MEAERASFTERARFDFLVALAVEHHLAIGRNIPLDEVVRWMVGLAPRGVIEFVQKTDATVRRMLSLREDIFADYTEENFRQLLAANARIVESRTVSAAGRVIFLYDRRPMTHARHGRGRSAPALTPCSPRPCWP